MITTKTAVSPDNLQTISGIGKATERALHEHNIHLFSEIASRSPEELYEMTKNVRGVRLQKIIDEDWPRQAKKLLSLQNTEETQGLTNGQHYATYQFKLLLEADNQVRYTNAIYLQKQEGDTWAGWDAQKVIAFMQKHANLSPTVVEPARGKIENSGPSSEKPKDTIMADIEPILHTFEAYCSESSSPRHLIHQQDDFDLKFEVELPNFKDKQLSGNLNLFARDLSSQQRLEIGNKSETFTDGFWGTRLPGKKITSGTYRLEANLELKTEQKEEQFQTTLPGGILMVI